MRAAARSWLARSAWADFPARRAQLKHFDWHVTSLARTVTSLRTARWSSTVVTDQHPRPSWTRAHVAFGSNVGDRVDMIEEAMRMLEQRSNGAVRLVRTSGLWQTKAMYVLDQDDFVNGVCEIDTVLPPEQLLDHLQQIENSLGRVKLVDKGPRCIDLDILLYGDLTMTTERLTIPHALMLEREFVLRPLSELIPHRRIPHPLATGSVKDQLGQLPASEPAPVSMFPLFKSSAPIRPADKTRSTSMMAIVNATPDSFSAGSRFDPSDSTDLRSYLDSIRPHTDILDIGGQSTKPNAATVARQEELNRVIPAIETAVAAGFSAISVDTFDSAVADAALTSGAQMVNDVYAGRADKDIFSVVARHNAAIVLTHSRGNASTMGSLANYPSLSDSQSPDDALIGTIARELRDRVYAAEAAGIRRWKIMLDPGLGFAKKDRHNLGVLRHLNQLKAHPLIAGFPWLVGPSRKQFIGNITGVSNPDGRVFGTAAAVSAAILAGADAVRVHDVTQMAEVAKMTDAIRWHQ